VRQYHRVDWMFRTSDITPNPLPTHFVVGSTAIGMTWQASRMRAVAQKQHDVMGSEGRS